MKKETKTLVNSITLVMLIISLMTGSYILGHVLTKNRAIELGYKQATTEIMQVFSEDFCIRVHDCRSAGGRYFFYPDILKTSCEMPSLEE